MDDNHRVTVGSDRPSRLLMILVTLQPLNCPHRHHHLLWLHLQIPMMMMMINNLQTAGGIIGIALLAFAPLPWEVSYLDWVKTAIATDSPAVATTTTEGIPPAVSAIATKTSQDFGIPLGVILAIAKHESGSFSALIGTGNAWGLKCVGNDPTCTTVKTQEHSGGTVGSYLLGFESCQDPDRCSRILGQTLTSLNTSRQWQDIPAALDAIGRRYATDPEWAAKVQLYLL